jgi:hypothetical protein
VGEERTILLPALQDLQLCRRLECSWHELQLMPEETVEMWEAVIRGEEQAQREASVRV